jgi:hypothetical protein|tara:strand:- start:3040 stop:3249 length:210 start_codon:yes stop_codon:yes gene_type:complete
VDSPEHKNELEIVKIQGELRLLNGKLDTIKSNDLRHIQDSIDTINKILWAVGLVVLGQLGIAVKVALWG